MNSNKIKSFLQKNIPELSIYSLQECEGQEHNIVEINNTWMFRFAKSSLVQKHMAIEVKLLKKLEGKTSWAIPQVVYYFPDAYCFGYKKISGVPLTNQLYMQLTEKQKRQLVNDLAQFLYELHSAVSLAEAKKLGLAVADWPLKPDVLQLRLSKVLTDKPLKKLFESFIVEYARTIDADKNVVLIHNDIHTNNIVIDPTAKQLSGIIDFTNAAIDTVYHDFRYLHVVDMELVHLVVQAYNQKLEQKLNVPTAYTYCLATEFSRLSEALEKNDLAKAAEIKERILQILNSKYFQTKDWATKKEMKAPDVVELLELCQRNGIEIIIDGGWGVDALLGKQTRPHGDLDIALQHKDVPMLRQLLLAKGYNDIFRDDTTESNFVMGDNQGHQIDFHSYTFNEQGKNIFGVQYPLEALSGSGTINGHPVKCIAPEWMVKFHTGYELDEQDYNDVRAICEHFGIPLPTEYEKFSKNDSK